ncbi:MAG: VanZ family protein [Spartobacteria bacterium]|nr:VanZ family protein [Spartobacteria bacterium]
MKYTYWIPALLWAALIFYASHMPVTDAPPLFDFPGGDKLLHFGVYGVLSIFLWVALIKGHGLRPMSACVLAMLITSAYGALDEWHQSFIPERSVELADWLADTGGGIVFLLLAMRLACKPRPRS